MVYLPEDHAAASQARARHPGGLLLHEQLERLPLAAGDDLEHEHEEPPGGADAVRRAVRGRARRPDGGRGHQPPAARRGLRARAALLRPGHRHDGHQVSARRDGNDALIFAVGIEDTAIEVPLRGSGQRLDEYELTGHLTQWREDLARAGHTGATAIRY